MKEGSLNLYGKSKPAILCLRCLMCVSKTWLELEVVAGSKQSAQPKSQKCSPVLQMLVMLRVGISTWDPFSSGRHFCRYNSRCVTSSGSVARCWLWACLKALVQVTQPGMAYLGSQRLLGIVVAVPLACVQELRDPVCLVQPNPVGHLAVLRSPVLLWPVAFQFCWLSSANMSSLLPESRSL